MISPESVADKIAMSKNERIKQDDIELEKSYVEALDRGYVTKVLKEIKKNKQVHFSGVESIIKRAILFGYVNRHRNDDRQVAKDVLEFVEICRETNDFYEEFPNLKQLDHDWTKDIQGCYNFNRTGIMNIPEYATYDPLIIFSDIRIGLPSGNKDAYLIRSTLCDVEFISFSHSARYDRYKRVGCDDSKYKEFLTEFYHVMSSCIKEQQSDSIPMFCTTDGMHSFILCKDIDFSHGFGYTISSLKPLEYDGYKDLIKRYFG